MKKSFLVLLFFAFASMQGQTSLKVERLDVSAGLFPTHNESYIFNAPLALVASFSDESRRQALPAYFIGISFVKVKQVEIGIELGYQPIYKPVDFFGNSQLENTEPKNPLSATTFMPRFRMRWLETQDHFLEFYSSMSAGVAFIYEGGTVDTFYPEPAGHVSLVGMSVGSKVRGFIEFGVGTRGLMMSGLSYSFQ